MRKYLTGAIVGKFYPYHKGHEFLIKEARKQVSGDLTIIVAHNYRQDIPGGVRAEWIRETHKDCLVVETDDNIPAEPGPWAERTKACLTYTPTAVFTSEEYGHNWAKELGCAHVLIDQPRDTVPINATAIRNNPVANWEFLGERAKQHLAKRICLVGAESTGKTTLALALTEHYRTVMVEEHGRTVTERILKNGGSLDDLEWTSGMFQYIAWMQQSNEDRAAQDCANGLVVCDTDAMATGIWHQRYLGYRSGSVEKLAERQYDLYILTDIDTPFTQDEFGSREDGNHRYWMHEEFERQLIRYGKPYIKVTGTHEERMAQATFEIGRILSTFRIGES